MQAVFTADLHLTNDVKDRYRWRIFKYIEGIADKKFYPDVIILGGDLTDHKDEHPSALVNFIVEWLVKLADYCPVILLRGNHDYIDEGTPFFRFLSGVKDNVTFITKPTERQIAGASCLFLPNTRHYEEDWKGLAFGGHDYIFCHQSFDGCVAENGTRLGGIPASVFGKTKAKIYSGDIHTPQTLKGPPAITYVGAPYRIRFGDDFRPRVLLIGETGYKDTHKHVEKAMYPNFMMKHLLDIRVPADNVLKALKASITDREREQVDILKGDQIKIRVYLDRAELPLWPKLKQKITKVVVANELELSGLEVHAKLVKGAQKGRAQGAARGRQRPAEVLGAYAVRQGHSEATKMAGLAFLKAVENG